MQQCIKLPTGNKKQNLVFGFDYIFLTLKIVIYLCRFPVSPTFLLFVRGVTAYRYEMFQFILVLYIFLESMHQCVL